MVGFFLVLLIAIPVSSKEVNPTDFPLKAKILTAEKVAGDTAFVNGKSVSSYPMERAEIQIGETVYIVMGKAGSLSAAKHLDEYVGQPVSANIVKHRLYLVIADKHGAPKVLALEITGRSATVPLAEQPSGHSKTP
jgi:hypothetical protein